MNGSTVAFTACNAYCQSHNGMPDRPAPRSRPLAKTLASLRSSSQNRAVSV